MPATLGGMADYYRCRNCEVRLVRLPKGRTVYGLGACSNCDATEWVGVAEGQATLTGEATVTATGQVISVGPALEDETARPATIRREVTEPVGVADEVNAEFEPTVAPEDLPREVIAEALSLNVNVLRPIDGKWPVDIEASAPLGSRSWKTGPTRQWPWPSTSMAS